MASSHTFTSLLGRCFMHILMSSSPKPLFRCPIYSITDEYFILPFNMINGFRYSKAVCYNDYPLADWGKSQAKLEMTEISWIARMHNKIWAMVIMLKESVPAKKKGKREKKDRRCWTKCVIRDRMRVQLIKQNTEQKMHTKSRNGWKI